MGYPSDSGWGWHIEPGDIVTLTSAQNVAGHQVMPHEFGEYRHDGKRLVRIEDGYVLPSRSSGSSWIREQLFFVERMQVSDLAPEVAQLQLRRDGWVPESEWKPLSSDPEDYK